MPRVPRLYRVQARYRNGEVKTRHYQTPEAAEERRVRFIAGRPAQLAEGALALRRANAEISGEPYTEPVDVPTVTVTPSWPVTYPRDHDESLPIPDSILPASAINALLQRIGIDPAAVVGMEWHEGQQLVLEYHQDTKRKSAPVLWRVEIEES